MRDILTWQTMTDEYGIEKDVDEDYIDVVKRRADCTVAEEPEDDDMFRDVQATAQQDMSHIFNVDDGSGAASAIDERIDKNAVIENDGRSKTRTFFYPEQADDTDTYKRLIRWQDGEGDSERAVANRAADRRRWIDTFCGYLDMTSYQQSRTEHIIESIQMSHMAHYSSQKVILATLTLVANEDGRFIRDETLFRKLMVDVGTDLCELKSIRSLVKAKGSLK